MGRWRDLLERFLPWYDAALERQREARTNRAVRRTEVARLRAARVISEQYEDAGKAARKR
jgi:hypothetical protein